MRSSSRNTWSGAGRAGARRWFGAIVLVALLVMPTLPAFAAPVATMTATERAGGDWGYLYKGQQGLQSYIAPPAPANGLQAQATTIIVDYQDFPPEAQAAFQYAVNIWQSQLTSPVPIRISASWEPLEEGLLGGAAAVSLFRNFSGAPKMNAWYPSALANKLAGKDLDPAEAEIEAVFNSSEDGWYFGTGQTPRNKVNFASTVLHEIGHGLGFSGSAVVNADGTGQWGFKTFALDYDTFVVNDAGANIIDTTKFPNPSTALATQLQSGKLYFVGPTAKAGNGGQPIKLYAPAKWEQGSSYSHLDEDAFPAGNPNALMTPYLDGGEANYSPGPIALGLLADLGWTVSAGPPPSPAPSTSPGPSASPNPSVAPGECVTFKETGKKVCGRFLQYWQANGGLTQQGLPLTDEFDEKNPTNGQTYKTQYFERARFEYHPENADPKFQVLLGLLGREQLLAKYGQNLPAVGTPLTGECATFAETSKQVCGVFLQYWRANGGLAQQGLPLSNIFPEINPTNGKTYPTQYFERARFEYHDENLNTPYIVLLGLLGREQLFARYKNGDPTAGPAPSASPSPPAAWGPTLTPLANGKAYSHPNKRFTTAVPTNWAQVSATDNGVIFASPDTLLTCNISATTAPGGLTLDLLDQAQETLFKQQPGYTAVKTDKVVVQGQNAYRRIYTFTTTTNGKSETTQIEAVYYISNGLVASTTCATVAAGFAAAAPTFDGIAGATKLAGIATAPTAPLAARRRN